MDLEMEKRDGILANDGTVHAYQFDDADLKDVKQMFNSKEEEQQFNRLHSQTTEYLEILSYESEGTQLDIQIGGEPFIFYCFDRQYCLETEEGELLLAVETTENGMDEFIEYLMLLEHWPRR